MRFIRFLSISAFALLLSAPVSAAASEFLLIDVRGDVRFKPEGQSHYQSAREGNFLTLGDRLRTAAGGQVRILCDDSATTWVMYSNQESGVAEGCPPSLFGTRLRIGNQDDNASGGNNPDIPYVVSPRRTAVLDSQPLLSWNPVSGAVSYTVQVVGSEITWETQTTDTEVRYTGESLIAGAEYQVIIEADNGPSSQLDEGSETATFELIYPEDWEIVQTAIANISEQNISAEIQALALANLYIREDLFAEAIDTLEPFAAAETNTFGVYQKLGDIYRYIGLNLLAEERYQQAINIALAEGAIEGLADARSGLAEVKLMLDQKESAIELLTRARDGYKVLENTERADELAERLEELEAS